MPNPTFLLTTLLNEYTLYHPEQPATAYPDTTRIGGAVVLWNPPNSNTKIYVKNMKVMNQMSEDNILGSAILNLNRISAYVSNDLTNNAQYIAKFDSSNPDLPSQVKVLTRVDSVTTVGASIRSFMNIPQNGDTILQARTIAINTAKIAGQTRRGLNTSNIFYGYGNSATQGQVLREGEGLAITPTGIQSNVAYRFSIVFKDASNHTYIATEVVSPYALLVPILIFNGSGSGVVLTVVSVDCQEMGTDSLCSFAVQKIDDIFLGSDELDVTSKILKMDSRNTLPAGLKCYTNCLVELAGVKQGAMTVYPTFRRTVQLWNGTGPTWNSGPRMYGTVSSSEIIDNGVSPLIIRPGEGIALMQKNASELGRYEATLFFQTEPLMTASSTAFTT